MRCYGFKRASTQTNCEFIGRKCRATPVFQTGSEGALLSCPSTERSLKVRRLLREQEEAGALPAALTTFRVEGPKSRVEGQSSPRPSILDPRLSTQLSPVWLSSDSSRFVNCRAPAPRECESPRRPHSFCSRSSNYQSATLRTLRLQVRVLPGAPFSLGMWFNPNSRGSRFRVWQPWGCNSLHAHQSNSGEGRELGNTRLSTFDPRPLLACKH